MKKILLYVFALITCFQLKASDYKTLTYFHNQQDSLDLDFFQPQNTGTTKTPLVIFVHGGGFSGLTREDGYLACRYLASHGIAAATISYTLYMKGKDFGCQGIMTEKIKAFRYAVTDLWEATRFMIHHAGEYNIDTAQIFIAGSSAGAETVLHAPYWPASYGMFGNGLPAGFKYAGVIAGSGAMIDMNVMTKEKIVPTMLFHGDSDPTVPYATAAHHYCDCTDSGWLMLFGSRSVYSYLKDMKGSVLFYSFNGGNHSCAGAFFNQKQQYLVDFIRAVNHGKKFTKMIKMQAFTK